MPIYTYRNGDEVITEMFPINDIPKEIVRDGKTYTYVPTFGTNFLLKGYGWASKGTATANKPKLSKEVGLKVDYDKKNAMEKAGERV